MSKVIAIDGPAGSGKGTIAKIIATKLNYINIDTGATYRCVSLATLRNNLTLDDKDKIIDLSSKIDIKLTPDGKVYLDGEDVTDLIRTEEISAITPKISSIPEVRENMVTLQRNLANDNNVVMEGRDITTVVFPDATYKFYLDASIEERAKRRYKQNMEKGINVSLEEIKENIRKRDYNDMHKEVGALKRTNEQIYIDTTNLSIEEVVDKMLEIIGDNNE